MKRIGILFGQERSFPHALVERINASRRRGRRRAGPDAASARQPERYDVILDRISQDIPFYRAYPEERRAQRHGGGQQPVLVERRREVLQQRPRPKIGVAVPKTVLLPSKEHPPDTTEKSIRTSPIPLDWDGIFEYIGFPAFFKPFAGGGWKNVYRVTNPTSSSPPTTRPASSS